MGILRSTQRPCNSKLVRRKQGIGDSPYSCIRACLALCCFGIIRVSALSEFRGVVNCQTCSDGSIEDEEVYIAGQADLCMCGDIALIGQGAALLVEPDSRYLLDQTSWTDAGPDTSSSICILGLPSANVCICRWSRAVCATWTGSERTGTYILCQAGHSATNERSRQPVGWQGRPKCRGTAPSSLRAARALR